MSPLNNEPCHGCAAGLFMEYPLVSTRKHIEEQHPFDDGSLAGSENDPDDLVESTPLPAPSLVGKIFDMNLCAPSSATQQIVDARVQTCCGCNRDLDEKEIYAGKIMIHFDDDDLDGNETGKREEKFFCCDCSTINQAKAEHRSALENVLEELSTYFETRDKSECLDLEPRTKSKGRGFGRMKKAMKGIVSSLKNPKLRIPTPELEVSLNESQETEETEEYPSEKENIQTVFSSPTSLHYQFDYNSDKHVTSDDTKKIHKNHSGLMKKAYSKSKRWMYSLEKKNEETRVKTVAVAW